jgi:hypothetical protein
VSDYLKYQEKNKESEQEHQKEIYLPESCFLHQMHLLRRFYCLGSFHQVQLASK